MRPHLLALALVAALAGCQPADAPTNGSTPAASQQAGEAAVDAAFADLSKRALDTWMQLSPVSATQIGDHRYDSELDDLSAAGQQKTVAAYKALLGELDKIDVAKLGRENQVDGDPAQPAAVGNLERRSAAVRQVGPAAVQRHRR